MLCKKLAFSLTFVSILVQVQPALAQPSPTCQYIGSVGPDGDCARQRLTNLEQEIVAKYGKPNLSSRDENHRLYAASQRAWIKYRDAQCELEASDFGDGSGGGLAYLECAIKKTEARIKELDPNNWVTTGN
jgi:Uncharacterized protein conserved in bacteria